MTPLGWVVLAFSACCFVLAAILGMGENNGD